MATRFRSATVLLVLATSVNSQFFADFFQGFQPFATNQPTYGSVYEVTRREQPKNYYRQTTKQEETTKSYDNERRGNPFRLQFGLDRDTNDYRRRKTNSSINSYTTTAKPRKKGTTRRLVTNDKRTNSQDYSNNNTHEYDGIINDIGDYYTQKPIGNSRVVYNNNYSTEKNNNNRPDSGNYYTTQKPNYRGNSRPDYSNNNSEKPNDNRGTSYYSTQKPIYESGNYYTTQKPNSRGNSRSDYNNNNSEKPNDNRGTSYYSTQKPIYESNNRQGNNGYYTENPFNKGVKPIVANGPPITNRPVNRTPSFGIDPRPKDDDAIAFPEDDSSPEVIIGPDEELMSTVEKKRYIELAERKCAEYKALGTKAVQAIPLLPSPEPVEINVNRCAPTTVPLVVGGKVVSIQEFPHMALLGWRKLQGGGYSWKCGGSLVSEQFILTAAHCSFQDRDNTVVNGPPTAVQLGSSYLDDPGALVVKVAAVIRHPKYKLPKSYYDLALVKLVNAVKFSEVVKPACLGPAPSVGKSIIATGWGRTQYGGGQSHELRSVSLPIWEMSRCQDVLGTSRKLPNGPMSDSQVCAGEVNGGKDTCQGDSGGPAQVQEDCIWRVVGVTSLGRSCGAAETPGLYAKIQRAFIASQVFGPQNIRNISINTNYGNNNGYSGNDNGNSGNNNGNSGNSWNNNANYDVNNREGSIYTERPNNVNINNVRPQVNSQGSNGNFAYNQAYGANNNEQDGYNNYNSQATNNRPTRYTTTQTPDSDSIVFNYNNDNYNQHYYTSTTQKPVRYNNANSQNYESNNRDQPYFNKQPTQRPQSNYGDNRQSNYENYTVGKPWWLT